MDYFLVNDAFSSGQGIIFYWWGNEFFKVETHDCKLFQNGNYTNDIKNNSNLESRKSIWSLNIWNNVQLFFIKSKTWSGLKRRITSIQEARIWKDKAVELPSCVPSSTQLTNSLAESKVPVSCNFDNLC